MGRNWAGKLKHAGIFSHDPVVTTPGQVDFDGERGLRNSEPSIFFGVTKSRPLNISPIPRLRGIVLAPMIKLLPNHVNQRVVLHLDIIGSWDIA